MITIHKFMYINTHDKNFLPRFFKRGPPEANPFPAVAVGRRMQPISAFQAVQWKLADMATELDAAQLLMLRAAWLQSMGKPFEKESAMG